MRGNFLTCSGHITFSRKTLLHAVKFMRFSRAEVFPTFGLQRKMNGDITVIKYLLTLNVVQASFSSSRTGLYSISRFITSSSSVALLLRNPVLPGSLGLEIDYSNSFPWFTSVSAGKSGTVNQMKPRSLPSTYFPIHFALYIIWQCHPGFVPPLKYI